MIRREPIALVLAILLPACTLATPMPRGGDFERLASAAATAMGDDTGKCSRE